MDSGIIISIITSVCSLIGVLMTVRSSWKKTDAATAADRAVMLERIEELTKSVEKHNNFAVRIPVLETKIEAMDKQIVQFQKQLDKLSKK